MQELIQKECKVIGKLVPDQTRPGKRVIVGGPFNGATEDQAVEAMSERYGFSGINNRTSPATLFVPRILL